MTWPWKKAPQPKSLADVAAEKAKMLRGWLQEIDEIQGGSPEEVEDAARRFAMRLKDFIRQTEDLLREYDLHVAHNFINAIENQRQGLIEQMGTGATYLEVVAADEHNRGTLPRLPSRSRPVVVQGWRPRTALSAFGGALAALLAAAVPVSLWAGDKLIDYGRLQARLELQRDLDRAREERDACRLYLEKLKAEPMTPPTGPGGDQPPGQPSRQGAEQPR